MSTQISGKVNETVIVPLVYRRRNVDGSSYNRIVLASTGKEGIPVIQVNTGGGCHLDANMISNVLSNMPLQDIELLFIENVGNLVCPAQFTIGEHKKERF